MRLALRVGGAFGVSVCMAPLGTFARRLIPVTLALFGGASATTGCDEDPTARTPGGAVATSPDLPPPRLSDTGLFPTGRPDEIAAEARPFEPRHALWTDGATKRRWIALPPGSSIDDADPERWVFPVGTRVWKEFALDGRPIETRYLLRRVDGSWAYATYRWRADGLDADRAPDEGVPHAAESAPGVPYDLPSVRDCRACHESGNGPVLGYSRFQLESRPAESDAERALGYLHANCAHCHNPRGPLASLGLDLHRGSGPLSTAGALRTALGASLRGAHGTRLVAGDPTASALWRRLASASPIERMPPRGTRRVDDAGVELIASWIRALDEHATTASPSSN